ncbi:MAG: hypothetical protein JRI23_16945 [Deltaproteobacteria bacterium]|nr:hypothetical protein [Deltaproteobacteria bacterium]MBW2533490.1 hypothetical protein [Deltaproteobacteria bacterium]
MAARTCGASCPCDGDEHGSQREGHHDGDDQAGDSHEERRQDDECPDECPDDCPDCGCCPAVVLAIVPLTMHGLIAPSFSLATRAAPETPTPGARFEVYRPPRSQS